jgi:hypothetical protein
MMKIGMHRPLVVLDAIIWQCRQFESLRDEVTMSRKKYLNIPDCRSCYGTAQAEGNPDEDNPPDSAGERE